MYWSVVVLVDWPNERQQNGYGLKERGDLFLEDDLEMVLDLFVGSRIESNKNDLKLNSLSNRIIKRKSLHMISPLFYISLT
jgi:hypothetical protein